MNKMKRKPTHPGKIIQEDYLKPFYLKVILTFEPENTKLIKDLIDLLNANQPLVRYYTAKVIAEIGIREASNPVAKAMALEEYEFVKKELHEAYRSTFYVD